MGMDLAVAVVPITRKREEALELVRSMSAETIIEALRHTYLDAEFTDHLYTFSEDDPWEVTGISEEMIPALEQAINITYDVAEDRFRLGTCVQFGDCKFAVAGGASWGDMPEYVDELWLVSMLGVTYDATKTLKWVD